MSFLVNSFKHKMFLYIGILFFMAGSFLPSLRCHAAPGLAANLNDNSYNYTTVLYNNKNGLPTSEANAIAETEDGFIWIGSYSGLIRYDGKEFLRISSATGLASVVSLYVDTHQRLWVGTNDSGVGIMGRGYINHLSKADGLPAASVRSITEDDDGYIYLATTRGLCIVNDNLEVEVLDIPQIKDEYINRVVKGPNDIIYGLTKSGSIFILKDRRLMGYYDEKALGISGVHALCVDDKDPESVYLATQYSEVFHGSFGSTTFQKDNFIVVAPLEYINSLVIAGGRLFVCADNGVGSIKKGKFQFYKDLDLNNSLEDMMVDYQGNLWFISSKLGVMKIVPNQFSDITKQCGLPETVATSTCIFNDLLLIGNKNNGIYAVKDGREVSFLPMVSAHTTSGEEIDQNDLIKMLDRVTIRSIIRDSKNNIWISTYSDYGLIKFNGAEAICFTEADGMPSNRARVVKESQNGDIIAGFIGGVAIIHDDKIIKKYGPEDGIYNSEILTVEEAANGDILAGSDGGGLFVISDGKVINITTDTGLSSDIIMRVKRDEEHGVFWLVTSNAIGYLDDDYKPTMLWDFPYPNNFDILSDTSGKLWILSSNGIYVVSADKLLSGKEYTYDFYDSTNGLPCIATANSYNEMTDDGELYISGTTGVAMININKPFEDVSSLKIDVPYIEADGLQVYPDENGVFNLSKDVNKVDITCYIFTYALMNPQVSYQLEGFDSATYNVKRSDFGTVSYTNLPGGKYKFVLNVADSQGNVFEEFSIDITKQKAFYEYLYAQILMAVAGMALVGLLVWRLMHITIISRQYEQIRAAKEDAERANTAKSRFLANMSHEIRTPINTIMGMNEMILREDSGSAPSGYVHNITGYASNIKIATESLLELINELLDLSKIESGKMEVLRQEYDTYDFIQSLTMMIKVRSNQKDLTFETEIDETLPKKLYGDVGKLKEVLLNLLTNSVKYTERGHFTLIMKNEAMEGDTCRIYFAVQDTGIGIKEEDMDKLFTAFKRLEELKNSGIQGTGLGLDISKKYVELMGGNLEVDSVYGQGSTFFFTLDQQVIDSAPIGPYKSDTPNRPIEQYVPEFIAPDARILVVDDNEMNLQVIKGLLKGIQSKLKLVTSGKACLELLSRENFDIVLLDHMMPEMDGIETLERIREINKDIVVIALTANIMNGGADFYKNAGFQDYLSKPVDTVALELMLMKYLRKELILSVDADSNKNASASESSEKAQGPELPDSMQWIYDVPGISVADGLKYTGMPDLFIKFLDSFYSTLDTKSKEIEDAYNNGDIELYTIKVHALKSTSRIMGAKELSALAEEMEFAGKANDTAKIDEKTPALLTLYRSYKEKLAPIKGISASREKGAISDAEIASAYDALREFIPQMDYDAVEMILDEMKVYYLPEKDYRIFGRLSDLLKNLDWEAMEKLLSKK